MPKIVTVDQMKSLEAEANASGYTYSDMMLAAGKQVAEFIIGRIDDLSCLKVTLLIGKGNNGGDGLVAARLLAESPTVEVTCLLLDDRTDDLVDTAKQAGVRIIVLPDPVDEALVEDRIHDTHVLVDALLGTGIRLPLTVRIRSLLNVVNQVLTDTQRTSQGVNPDSGWIMTTRIQPQMVVAVDCPSGLQCDTGEVDESTIQADYTITFAAAKHGQLRFPGANTVGKLIVADIGIPHEVPTYGAVKATVLSADDVAALMPTRRSDAHKGSFGTVSVIAGSLNYPGAAGLSGKAAYRVGAGLVRMAVPAPVQALIASAFLEAIWQPLPHLNGAISKQAVGQIESTLAETSLLLIGPGMGRDKVTDEFFFDVLMLIKRSEESSSNLPRLQGLVIDADGLNMLASRSDWNDLLPKSSVLTPHIGEMSRLTGLDKQVIIDNRIAIASEWSQKWDSIVVLKGAFTVVAHPDGRIAVSPFATDALAKAGSGDVLAGMIAGFMAQGCGGFEAAKLSVFLHGLAGVSCGNSIGSRSVTATDLIEALPIGIQELDLQNTKRKPRQ